MNGKVNYDFLSARKEWLHSLKLLKIVLFELRG